jgi:hypothetical protein
MSDLEMSDLLFSRDKKVFRDALKKNSRQKLK